LQTTTLKGATSQLKGQTFLGFNFHVALKVSYKYLWHISEMLILKPQKRPRKDSVTCFSS